MNQDRSHILIRGARENNLQGLDLDLPKNRIIAFTGVSGSGKSSLVLDTIAAQSRRELNETFPSFVQQFLPKYGRPHVESIRHLPVAIVIDQRKPARSVRSTVGTYTDIYSLLRLLFSRVGSPFVGYSDAFSFNHPEGKCPRCDGLGEINELDVHKLVDFSKSLNEEGCIRYDVAFGPGLWRWKRYAFSGLFDLDKKIRDYSPEALELFLYSPQIRLKNPPQNWPKSAKYEGLMPRMYRSVVQSEEGKLHMDLLEPMLTSGRCPDCGGSRLNDRVLACKIGGLSIAETAHLPLPQLAGWIAAIDHPMAVDLGPAILSRLEALISIGLSYLSLDRGMGSLSGGEAQRCKIAKYINSPLSDVVYILDEPSVGLHSHDIKLMTDCLLRLRDHGNTVLLVEHHREMIACADHVIDLGPGAGAEGGQVLFQGSYPALLQSGTLTGQMLKSAPVLKENPRVPTGWVALKDVRRNNLKGFDIDLPLGVLALMAGVAGAGKTSLAEELCDALGPETLYISQKNIGISLRSTPATYLDVADDIRKVFAKGSGKSASLFSFNGKGACPVCGGKGIIVSDMAFMEAIETVCEACGGLRYNREALEPVVDNLNIAQVMDLPVSAAIARFAGSGIAAKLEPMARVGLGYIHLNQALSTLSGGELQRLKLASHLGERGKVFVLDEPLGGLHLKDIQGILALFDSMVEAGNSLFLAEHSLHVLASADFVAEVGPGGGEAGGQLLFAGQPSGMPDCAASVTGPYLKRALEGGHG